MALKHAFLIFSGDVIDMIDKMIRVVDGELTEEGFALPQTRHWNRFLGRVVPAVTFLPTLLGVSALAILAVPVVAPIVLSNKVYRHVLEGHL